MKRPKGHWIALALSAFSPVFGARLSYQTEACRCQADYDSKDMTAEQARDSAELATGEWAKNHRTFGSDLFCGQDNLLQYDGKTIPASKLGKRLEEIRGKLAESYQDSLESLQKLKLIADLEPVRQAQLESVRLSQELALREIDFFQSPDPKLLTSPLLGKPMPPLCAAYARLIGISNETQRLKEWEAMALSECAHPEPGDLVPADVCSDNVRLDKERMIEDRSALCNAVLSSWHNCVNGHFRQSDAHQGPEMIEPFEHHLTHKHCSCHDGE